MKKIEELIKKESKIHKEIQNEIDRLDGSGMECHCEDRETYTYIFWGEFPELFTVCINCGGVVY